MVDLRLFSGRNFGFGVMTISAGYALAPVGVLAILLTPLAGRKVTVWDPRWMVTASFVVFGLVLSMRANFTPQTDFGHIMLPTIIQGAAMAFYFLPLTTILMAGIAPDRIAAAAGLSNFSRITAGAMGTSIATTLWEDRATLHHAHLTEGIAALDPAFNQAVDLLVRSGMSVQAAMAQVVRQIDQQAFTRAAADIFHASALIFLALIGLVWLTRRPPPVLGPGGAR